MPAVATYVEQDCTIEGRAYTAGGAIVTDQFIIGYPAKGGILTDWHGAELGTWRSVASWRVHSFIGSTMHQIEARVDGVTYTGRGFGEGMIYKGKRKATQR